MPQLREVKEVVHALFEYTPKVADVDTVPAEGRFEDVLKAP